MEHIVFKCATFSVKHRAGFYILFLTYQSKNQIKNLAELCK